MTGSSAPRAFTERLFVPLRWWVQSTMMLVSVWLACIVATPPWLAWTITGACTALVVTLLLAYGSARTTVSATELRSGRAHIERRFIAGAEALDKEATRAQLGPDADARAFLMTRPYVHRSVLVTLADPSDPTPYWLITSRRPKELAEALSRPAR